MDVLLDRVAAEALEVLRTLDDKHYPTTRAKRPDWEVCAFDSMTWPCDTQKALNAAEPFLPVPNEGLRPSRVTPSDVSWHNLLASPATRRG